MPELPEVETVVRAIRPIIVGTTILRAEFSVPRQLEPQSPRRLSSSLRNQKIVGVTRRGKYILVQLERGVLLIHLRMSGRLYTRAGENRLAAHERARWWLSNGLSLVFNDVRTLGTIRYFKSGEELEPLRDMGWEPLEETISGSELQRELRARSMAIKPVLLDQSLWAGIGNIYASEALWEAKIHPAKPAKKLTHAECDRLTRFVPMVLSRAIDQGGSTLRDFMRPDGTAGSYQHEFRVYDREADPCLRCNSPIVKLVQSQRSTYYCKNCQKK